MKPELSLNQIVGRNAKRIREALGYTQEGFREWLEPYGLEWSQSTLSQKEMGDVPITVNELMALSLALHVSPVVLLYPPYGVQVGMAAITGEELAERLWDRQWVGVSSGFSAKRMFLESIARELDESDLDSILDDVRKRRKTEAFAKGQQRAAAKSKPKADPPNKGPKGTKAPSRKTKPSG